MKLDAQDIRRQAEKEVQEEAAKAAKDKLKTLYKRKAAAEEVVKQCARDIEVALAEIGEGA